MDDTKRFVGVYVVDVVTAGGRGGSGEVGDAVGNTTGSRGRAWTRSPRTTETLALL